MKKSIIGLSVVLLTGVSGLLWAEDALVPASVEVEQVAVESAVPAALEVAQAAVEVAAPVEVNNTICPLSGRELKLGEEEVAKLEYNGKIYNVCPQAKAIYDQDPSSFAEKLTQFAAPQMEQMHAQMQESADVVATLADDSANIVNTEAVETAPENATP